MNVMSTMAVLRRVAIAACIVATTSFCTAAIAQDESIMPKPTREHKLLKNAVGTWDATMKFWPKPDAEPMVSSAVEKNHMMRGGFWLLSRLDGKFGEMPFSGSGTFGYDPYEKKYVATWVDNMSPSLMTMKGEYDDATKTMTMTGESPGHDGKMMKSKEITRHIDDDTRIFELHMPGPDGKLQKMLEITYKRRAKESDSKAEKEKAAG
jgi:hypothetical protein